MTQTGILARILTASDFGLLGMAMTAVGLAQVFAEMGVSGAVIPRQEADSRRLSTIYWMNVVIGLSAFVTVAAGAPLVAAFYGHAELVGITIAAASTLVIAPVGSLQRVLLQKELNFKALASVEIASEILGVCFAVGGALAGLGVFAFVVGMVVRSLFSALAYFYLEREWRPVRHWKRSDLRGYLGFSSFQLGGRCLNFFAWSADKILIGRLLGEDALGFYQVAWNLMVRPMSAAGQVVHRVFLPLFARMRGQKPRLGRSYLKLLHMVAFSMFPLYVGLFVVARPLIEVYLGPGWQPTADALRVLVFLGMLHAVGNPLGSLLTAIERVDAEFYMNCLVVAVTIPAIYLGSSGGILGIAYGLLGIELFLFYPLEAWIRSKLVGLPFWSGARAVVRPLLLSGVMGAVVVALGHWGTFSEGGRGLVLSILVGCAVYALLSLTFERELLRDLRALGRRGL